MSKRIETEGKEIYHTGELIILNGRCYMAKERNPLQMKMSCLDLCSLSYKCWSRRDKRKELEGLSCEELIGDFRFFEEFKDGI